MCQSTTRGQACQAAAAQHRGSVGRAGGTCQHAQAEVQLQRLIFSSDRADPCRRTLVLAWGDTSRAALLGECERALHHCQLCRACFVLHVRSKDPKGQVYNQRPCVLALNIQNRPMGCNRTMQGLHLQKDGGGPWHGHKEHPDQVAGLQQELEWKSQYARPLGKPAWPANSRQSW